MDSIVYIREAASILGIQRQAVLLAITNKRLKAVKDCNGMWQIFMSDLMEYKAGKYKRENSALINGRKIYSGNNLTIRQAAEMLGESTQYIYNEVYSGKLRSSYLGAHLIVFRDDIEEILKQNGEVAHL